MYIELFQLFGNSIMCENGEPKMWKIYVRYQFVGKEGEEREKSQSWLSTYKFVYGK